MVACIFYADKGGSFLCVTGQQVLPFLDRYFVFDTTGKFCAINHDYCNEAAIDFKIYVLQGCKRLN